MWPWRKKKVVWRQHKAGTSVTKHYIEHKELARELVLERLAYFNLHYGLEWKRVAIRNQRRCWGSCSSLKNLNFNYKILFLPPYLRDYIIIHELCHLVEMNHGAKFWQLVAELVPDYKSCIAKLKVIDKSGHSAANLIRIQTEYVSATKMLPEPKIDTEASYLPTCTTCGQGETCNCLTK